MKIEKEIIVNQVLENPALAIRELCNRDFYWFLRYFWPVVSSSEFVPNWHIEYICGELQGIAERVASRLPKEHDLIINVPPGTTKSITCSIMFPIWCWTLWHWMWFITASYSADLSLKSARFSRELIRSARFQQIYPELWLSKDVVSDFQVSNRNSGVIGGDRFSTSVGGTLMGFHGDILIVDDPLDPRRAASDLELQTANDWIDLNLSTRKTDKAVTPLILIHQRLHQNDPTGHLLAKSRLKIKHVCLPGEINSERYVEKVNPPELIGRYIDGLLDPVRMNVDNLAELEESLGQYGYAGQIGQDPAPPSGGMFQVDRFAIVDTFPDEKELVHVVRAWDKAGTAPKKGSEPSWTV